ncbi:BTAD domain-containing putative transcriptional regulator [Krasilnikovia sp. M28-CT-15]|uniref:AfsR/SARP family transcriptional regulator n=1 Tax=Krasilnikovia sp. M28-CT-15 TaxID=3373540 RepID=UPI00399CCBFE
MRIHLLGPFEVCDGDVAVPLGGPKPSGLLALMALQPGRAVSTDRIVDALWGDSPPTGVRNQVQVYVSGLRRALADHGGGPALLTRGGGYQLDLPPGSRDLDDFEDAVSGAELAMAKGRLEEASARLHEALAIWRGSPLHGLDLPFVAAAAAELAESHLAARQRCIDVDLRLGRHPELLPQLTALVAEDPLHEGFRLRIMLALYQAGRPAEALAAYREGRRVLVAELGIEPGAPLRAMEEAILSGLPPSQLAERVLRPAPGGRSRPPRQLPPDVPWLVGRESELDAAASALAGTGPSVTLVTGQPGAGKTAFAVHLAHLVEDRYPDGQLFAELRGAHPQPASPYDVLGSFLRVLGLAPTAVPHRLDERVVAYRTLTARRRVLVLLDDAADESQVRPLLPAGAGFGVLATSRDCLAGLTGHRVPLGVLSRDQALALLGSGVGAHRVAAEPDSAEAIIAVCGRLPLAVRIAAARLTARPNWRLARLAQRLRDQRGRLDELAAGDLAVRASLALSYQGLDERRAAVFRGLGLLDVESFPAWVAAALLELEVDEAERAVESLVDVHLLEAVGESRYQFHDLVRLYARERADREDSAAARDAAVRRVGSAYLHLASRCGGDLGSDFLGLVDYSSRGWALPDHAAATLISDPLAWFDGERAAVSSIVDHTIEHGAHELAGELAAALARLFEARSSFDDWRRTHERALAAVRIHGGRHTITAALLRNLGELHTIQDRYDLAATSFEEALAEAAAAGEPAYRAAALAGLGYVCRLLGRYDQALSCFEQGRLLAEDLGNPRGVAYAVNGCGAVYLERGALPIARLCFEEALTRSTAIDYLPGVATALRGLGHVRRVSGQARAAAGYYERARDVAKQLDNVLFDAHAAEWLGDVWLDQGRQDEAQPLLAWCLSVFRSMGNRFGEASTLRTLARAHLAAGRLDQARECALTALATWQRIQSPYWCADTLEVLALVHEQGGDHGAAAQARNQARTLRTGCGIDASPSSVRRSTVPY